MLKIYSMYHTLLETCHIAMEINNCPHVKEKKRRKWKNGTVARREVAKLSKSTHTIIPPTLFSKLVREIANELDHNISFSKDSIKIIHEVSEQMLTTLFLKANLLRMHSKRETLYIDDVKFAKYLTDNMHLLSNALEHYRQEKGDTKCVEPCPVV